VVLVALDIADGLLDEDAGADLIRRVWARAEPDEPTDTRLANPKLAVSSGPAVIPHGVSSLHKAG
jgi:hypothetical protein